MSRHSPTGHTHENESAESPQTGRVRLTDAVVKGLRCPVGKKDTLFFDDTLKGFGVRVMPDRADGKARKVFLLQYRAGDKIRREPLGDWGAELTTAQARRKAEAIRGAVRDRRDPVGERKAKEAADRTAAAEAKRKATVDAFTVAKLVDEWEARALSLRRPDYRKQALALVRGGLVDLLGRPAATITRSDAVGAVRAAADARGLITGNRLLAYARACYGWAFKADLVQGNPFANLARPGRERSRDRTLSAGEIRAVWVGTEALEVVPRAYVRFLLLTLQRRTETAGARWSEFTPELATWTVPAHRAKNGRAQLVHMAPAAREVLATLPRRPGQDLLFASSTGTPITIFSDYKRTLDARIAENEAEAAAAEGREPVAMPEWKYHDFRRSGITALAGLGFAPHVCDRLLNHVTGTIQGVAAVYQRAEFLVERRAALEAWAGFVVPVMPP